MTEPTLVDRAVMLAKTLASTVAWIASLVATVARGKFGSRNQES